MVKKNLFTYWRLRDQVKEEIAAGIRERLIDKYLGTPVVFLRDHAESIHAINKSWIADLLSNYEYEGRVSWQIMFDFKDDEQGFARVSDFTVLVEGM